MEDEKEVVQFPIDKGVAKPNPVRGFKSRYPFKEMEVGDSFFIPEDHKFQYASIYNSAKLAGIKVSCRAEGSGHRVWRIA